MTPRLLLHLCAKQPKSGAPHAFEPLVAADQQTCWTKRVPSQSTDSAPKTKTCALSHVQALAAYVQNLWGGVLDGLVNNVGTNVRKPIHEARAERPIRDLSLLPVGNRSKEGLPLCRCVLGGKKEKTCSKTDGFVWGITKGPAQYDGLHGTDSELRNDGDAGVSLCQKVRPVWQHVTKHLQLWHWYELVHTCAATEKARSSLRRVRQTSQACCKGGTEEECSSIPHTSQILDF